MRRAGLFFTPKSISKCCTCISNLTPLKQAVVNICRQNKIPVTEENLSSLQFLRMHELITQGVTYFPNTQGIVVDAFERLVTDRYEPLSVEKAFQIIADHQTLHDPALHILKISYGLGFRPTQRFNAHPEYSAMLEFLMSNKLKKLTLEQACAQIAGFTIEQCQLLRKIYPHGGHREHVLHFSAQHPDLYLHRIRGRFPEKYYQEHQKRVEQFIKLIATGEYHPDQAIRVVDDAPTLPKSACFAPR